MYSSLGEYELDVFRYSINMLMVLKYIREQGFDIKDFSITIDIQGDYGYGENDYDKCSHDLLEIVLETGNINIIKIDEEVEEKDVAQYFKDMGSTMVHEYEMFEMLIPLEQKDIMKYIANLKLKSKNKSSLNTFNRKLSDIFEKSQSKFDLEVFCTKTYSKVYMCTTDWQFLEIEFVDELLELIDFCKNENLKMEASKC